MSLARACLVLRTLSPLSLLRVTRAARGRRASAAMASAPGSSYEGAASRSQPVPMKKTLVVVNDFIASTTRFLNHFGVLAEEKLLIVQGTGFNWPAPDHFRLVFLPSADDLVEAITRIERFLGGYRRRHLT